MNKKTEKTQKLFVQKCVFEKVRDSKNGKISFKVPIIENHECEAMYHKKGHYTKTIFPSFVCTGYEEGGKNACQVSMKLT